MAVAEETRAADLYAARPQKRTAERGATEGFSVAYVLLLLYTLLLFVRPQEWVAAMHGWRLMAAFGGATIVAWPGHMLHTEWRFRDAPQNRLIIGLFAAVLMSHVAHTYLAATIDSFQTFGKLVITYFLFASLLTSTRRIKGLVWVLVAGCLFLSAHGILQAHRGYGFGGDEPMFRPILHEGQVRVRALGFFHDPNDLALMLVLVLPFLFSNVIGRGRILPTRVVSAAACVPMIYTVFLTNSRGGWLAFGVMLMFYIALRMRRRALGAVMASVVLLAVMAVGPSRMGGGMSDDSARNRVMAWGYANQMLKSWPLFGAGYGRFTEFSDESRVAHNSFAHCWAELGLFGYFFWLGLSLASLKDGWALGQVKREGGGEAAELSALGLDGMTALIGFLAAAMFLSRTYTIPLYVLFAFMGAVRTVYVRNVGPLKGAFDLKENWRQVAWAVVLTIPGLYVLIRLLN